MHELINRLTEKAGITAEQAQHSIEAIKDYVKEKFPMMAGAVDNLFASSTTTTTPTTDAVIDSAAPKTTGNVLDKISDVIPGETGQKVEDFVKDASNKVEDAYDHLKNKLSNFLDGDKK